MTDQPVGQSVDPTGSSAPRRSSSLPPGISPSMSLLADHWGFVLTYGVITMGFGLVLAVWPDETLKVIAVLIGIQLIITGVFRIILAIASSSLEGGSRVLIGLFGALALIVGLLCLRDPLQTLLAIGVILGVWWFAAGVVDIIGAIMSPSSRGRGWDIAMGVISLLAGGFLLVNPETSLGVLVIVVCVWLFAYGFIAIVAAFALRSARSTGAGAS
jgi:uncharacterized membrane protein HdeD (DUF308 family)